MALGYPSGFAYDDFSEAPGGSTPLVRTSKSLGNKGLASSDRRTVPDSVAQDGPTKADAHRAVTAELFRKAALCLLNGDDVGAFALAYSAGDRCIQRGVEALGPEGFNTALKARSKELGRQVGVVLPKGRVVEYPDEAEIRERQGEFGDQT